MNWAGLALLGLEYLPTWIDFAKKEEPAVADFIAKAKAAIYPVAMSPPVVPGTATPATVIPQLQQLGTLLPQLLGQLQSGKINLPGGFTS